MTRVFVMHAELHKVRDEGEILIRVKYLGQSKAARLVDEVILEFASVNILVSVDSVTDEISINSGADIGSEAIDVSHTPEWKNAIGHAIVWCWGLVNCQGYADGLQIRFDAEHRDDHHTVQLIAVASGLRVFVVAECVG